MLTSCMACFAFKAAKSAGSAAPPAVPHAESGTIIGLAAPMPAKKEEKPADLKDEEKGEKGKEAIWKIT